MRVRKKLIALLLLMVLAVLSQAQEFWMQSIKFFFTPGEKAVINFKTGESFNAVPWSLSKNNIAKLEYHHLDIAKNLVPEIPEGERDNLQLTLAEEGTHLIALQTRYSFVDVEAEKFNAFLKEEGLDDAYYQREKVKTLDKNGKERYAQYTKLFLQAGSKTDATWKKQAGFPLEIMPEQDPYQLKVGSRVSFKLLFNGKPLFGARVKVWNLHNNRVMMQPVYSQQDGVVEAHISNSGTWMVSVVKMIPSKDPKADWESYRGSLVFGVK